MAGQRATGPMILLQWLALAALLLVAGPGLAQTEPAAPATPAAPGATPAVQSSQVLTLDQERLFLGSAYGARVMREIEVASKALAAENREIEARLEAEEKDLTTRRTILAATEFRPLADAFDARVVGIRRVQDEKLATLNGRRDLERQVFYQAALPVLGDLVREAGAVAILDARAVFLSADRIDITDEAIVRIDQLLGAGPIAPDGPVNPETPAPAATPDPAVPAAP